MSVEIGPDRGVLGKLPKGGPDREPGDDREPRHPQEQNWWGRVGRGPEDQHAGAPDERPHRRRGDYPVEHPPPGEAAAEQTDELFVFGHDPYRYQVAGEVD